MHKGNSESFTGMAVGVRGSVGLFPETREIESDYSSSVIYVAGRGPLTLRLSWKASGSHSSVAQDSLASVILWLSLKRLLIA